MGRDINTFSSTSPWPGHVAGHTTRVQAWATHTSSPRRACRDTGNHVPAERRRTSLLCSMLGDLQPSHQLHGAEQDAPETRGFSESLGNQDISQVPSSDAPSLGLALTSTQPKCFPLQGPHSSAARCLMHPHLLPSFFPHLNSATLLFPALASGTTLGERGPGSVSLGCKRCRHSLTGSGTRLHSLLLTGTFDGVPSHKLQWISAQHTPRKTSPSYAHPTASFCWLQLQ